VPKILLIDDDETIRAVLSLTLERAGHTVILAGDGREGLRYLEQNSVDLVVTDIVMPETEGMELIQRLRTTRPHLKIIVMSGGGRLRDTSYLESATLLGANYALTKPFGGALLLAAVEAVLGGKPGDESTTG
jgi:DNA-binding response OmpR family regulator